MPNHESLNQSDIKFLIKLQKEMNTQTATNQTNPQLWSIAQTERQYHGDDDATGWELHDYNDNIAVAKNEDELYDWLKHIFIPKINENAKTKMFDVEQNDAGQIEITDIMHGGYYSGLEDIEEWINEYGTHDYEIIYHTDIKESIVKNLLFLTKRSAEEYLYENPDEYAPDAHPHLITAYESPEIARICKIIQKTDWSLLQKSIND